MLKFKEVYIGLLIVCILSMIFITSWGQEKVELVLWEADWNKKIATVIIKEFEEKNPGIKVRGEYFPWDGMVDKYSIALRNDSGPDIVNIALDWITPFAAMGKLLPIDEFIAADKMDMSDFFEGSLLISSYNGKRYALPYQNDTEGIFFNKKIFAEAGLNPDEAPETWAQLLEYAKATTKGDVFGFGLVGRQIHNLTTRVITLILCNGGSLLNNDYKKCTLNEPSAVEAVQFYVDMYRKHEVTPRSTMENENVQNRNLFAAEKVAMIMDAPYSIAPVLEANPNIQMGTALVPKMKIRKSILGGWSMAITNTAKDKEAAWKFIKFIASTEIAPRYTLTFPSRKSASKNERYNDPYLKPFIDSLLYTQPLPQIPQLYQIKQILYDKVQYALMGEKTVEQAMNEAVKEIDELLK